MSVNLNFENPKNLKKTYNTYSIKDKTIVVNNNSPYDRFCGGVPLSKGENRTVYVDQTDSHSMVFGSTGSKKTRTVVMPTVKIMGAAGESMIINDPKGELFYRLSGELRQQGYNILTLNFRDPARSNAWNPLAIPYQWYLENDIDKAAELVNDMAINILTSENIGNGDPFWPQSAADMFFGLTLLLFKYCKEHNIPQQAANITNLLILRRKLFDENDFDSDFDLWKFAQEDELIASSLSGVIASIGAKGTKAGILSTFDQRMRTFIIQPTLMEMLSALDFDIGSITEKKTALFIITPDEKSAFHKLVSLFVKQSYEYTIYKAMKNPNGKVSIRLNYVLDEFGTLPAITDMNSMIAAARSRDIRFVLITQSKHQLIQHYGDDAQTIISNCNNWIFLTSREIELLQDISLLCGQDEKQKPNMSIFDLQHFDKDSGEALLLCARKKPCKVNLLDISEYYFPDYKYIASIEIPLRASQQNVKLDFVLSDEIQIRLGIKSVENDEPESKASEEPSAFLRHSLFDEFDDDMDEESTRRREEQRRNKNIAEIKTALFELMTILKSETPPEENSGDIDNETGDN